MLNALVEQTRVTYFCSSNKVKGIECNYNLSFVVIINCSLWTKTLKTVLAIEGQKFMAPAPLVENQISSESTFEEKLDIFLYNCSLKSHNITQLNIRIFKSGMPLRLV